MKEILGKQLALKVIADFTALSVTPPTSLQLGLDQAYPGCGGDPCSAE